MNKEERQIAEHYAPLFDEISAILFRYDPVGINFEENRDEYNPEAATILQRLHPAIDAEGLRLMIHEEFERWFGAETAGEITQYDETAADILAAYRNYGSPVIE